MPTCVPVSNNNVTDVNANKPAANNDSKLHKIMACLFWKKKTDVVDMKKDSVSKKQKLTVDRSERSRRVLKMESMRELPKQREQSQTNTKVQTSASKQMFLPSENPTASFLSYINPSVRRACSDVIKTSSESLKPKSKEAFVQEARPVRTRNTNYRSQRATDREPVSKGILGKPPKLPTRTQSQTQPTKKPIVVPGIMAGSDDDIGYNSDNDIDDLHEEMRRMNLSHPDLRNGNASKTKSRRRREGSISVSEDSDASSDNEKPGVAGPSRPENPSPVEMPDRVKQRILSNETDPDDAKKAAENTPGGKKKSMEQVIDALFQQTQSNLDTIYQNGLEQLEEIETYRAETATPETCMKRLEEQLRETSDEESNPNTNGAFVNRKTSASSRNDNKTDKKSGATQAEGSEKLEEYVPEMDGLLTEVSVWAKDRQTWLLSEGKRANIRREDTSVSFNDRVIEHVTRSNDDKCTEWVQSQNKDFQETSNNGDSKVSGILTGPKLFRSSSRQAYQRRIGFSENDTNQIHEQNEPDEQINRMEPNIKFLNSNMNRNGLLVGNAPNVVNLGSLPGFGRQSGQHRKNDEDNFSLMYCDDRSTIDDNLSDMEQPPNYPSRSPDSWISSVVSYPNRNDQNADNHNDSFEGSVPHSQRIRDKQPSAAKRSASSPAKSHQIVRIAPKIYTPFMNIEKSKINKPLIGESKSFSGMNKPMIRNTQLRPLPASRPPRPMEMINQMSGLDTLSSNSFSGTSGRNVYRGSRNMLSDLDAKIPVADVSQRPYSEIPLRATSLTTFDKNNSSNLKQNEPPPYMPRPASETVPTKKIDKIGMGQVMATDSTKERNKYAREIVNSFHKNRIHSQSAIDETQEEKGEGQHVGNHENKHKRHTVFNNSLLKGGYTYDKHSRTRSRENSVKYSLQENKASEQTDSTGNMSNASTSQLHLSVADSACSTIDQSHTPTSTGNQGNTNAGETVLASGGKNVQSHIHGISGQEPVTNEDINKTAARFKRLRSRRDQEIEWLMKDAAETEV